MVEVPALIAVNNPVVPDTVITAGLLLVHVPPLVALLRVRDVPSHTDVTPVMAAGPAITVMTRVAEQLVPSV